MIGRIALILIAVALILAMMGKLRPPPLGPRKPVRKVEAARKCPSCGAWVVDGQPCGCGRGAREG